MKRQFFLVFVSFLINASISKADNIDDITFKRSKWTTDLPPHNQIECLNYLGTAGFCDKYVLETVHCRRKDSRRFVCESPQLPTFVTFSNANVKCKAESMYPGLPPMYIASTCYFEHGLILNWLNIVALMLLAVVVFACSFGLVRTYIRRRRFNNHQLFYNEG